MSFVYTPAKLEIANGAMNLQEAGVDIRMMLVMTNSTADTDQDTKFIGSVGTLDEMDGANYVRKACANQVTTEVDASNLAKFSFDPITWTALGVGTRQVLGAVLFRFVTNDADSILLAYIDTGGFPFNANGGDVLFTPNAAGVLQVT